MLKKLRRRFILVGMSAFAVVAITLIASINVANYYRTTAAQDETLQRIHEYNLVVSQSPGAPPPITDMPWSGGAETEFTFRFFSVRCNREGRMLVFDSSYISSVDEESAKGYAAAVLGRHKTCGYYKDYRYLVTEDGDELEIIFLNVADADSFRNTLLITSCIVGANGLLLLFILITVLSGYAVRPYAKNIQQQKQFITDASHELKTPVTSISTSADILALENEGSEWVENIRTQSVHLAKLIGNLVTLSRLNEEQPFPDAETFSLSEAVWELAEPFRTRAAAEGRQFFQDIGESILYHGDRASIQQLLSVLLDNALRYSDDGGTVRLSLRKKHGNILLEVYNTCRPLPDIDLNRLFDRFYRPDSSRSKYTGGSGIGLSIAAAIAERHGGTISVSSKDRTSITFTVRL